MLASNTGVRTYSDHPLGRTFTVVYGCVVDKKRGEAVFEGRRFHFCCARKQRKKTRAPSGSSRPGEWRGAGLSSERNGRKEATPNSEPLPTSPALPNAVDQQKRTQHMALTANRITQQSTGRHGTPTPSGFGSPKPPQNLPLGCGPRSSHRTGPKSRPAPCPRMPPATHYQTGAQNPKHPFAPFALLNRRPAQRARKCPQGIGQTWKTSFNRLVSFGFFSK